MECGVAAVSLRSVRRCLHTPSTAETGRARMVLYPRMPFLVTLRAHWLLCPVFETGEREVFAVICVMSDDMILVWGVLDCTLYDVGPASSIFNLEY